MDWKRAAIGFAIWVATCVGACGQVNGVVYREGHGLRFIAYLPPAQLLEPGLTYPLILYMHGTCGECTTHERITLEGGFAMWHNWGANTQSEPTFVVAPAGGSGGWISDSRRAAVLGIVDDFIATNQVDLQRIYAMGFSAGGAGVWNYIQTRTNFFAAGNPQAFQPVGLIADRVRTTPLWVTVGELEPQTWLDNLSAGVAAVRAANGDPRGALTWVTGVNPRFTIFPGVDHGGAQGATQTMPGFREWLLSQRRDGNIRPNIWLASPGNGSVHGAGIDVPFEVVATDDDGPKPEVILRVDGIVQTEVWTEPGTRGVLRIEEGGAHTIEAVATDPGGKFAVAQLSVTIEPVSGSTGGATSGAGATTGSAATGGATTAAGGGTTGGATTGGSSTGQGSATSGDASSGSSGGSTGMGTDGGGTVAGSTTGGDSSGAVSTGGAGTTGAAATPPRPGDYSGDGDPDIAMQRRSVVTLAVDVTALAPSFEPWNLPLMGRDRATAIGDAGGDARSDVAIQRGLHFEVRVHDGAGGRRLGGGVLGRREKLVASGDENGDGALDLLVQKGRAAHWLRGTGFLERSTLPLNRGDRVAAAGVSEGTLRILIQKGRRVRAWDGSESATVRGTVRAAADFDGDGRWEWVIERGGNIRVGDRVTFPNVGRTIGPR